MNGLQAALAEIGQHLDRFGVEWALVGGLAVSVRTEPRFTRDVDLAVAVESDRAAEELVRSLQAEGYQLLEMVEQEEVERLATARLVPPGESSDGIVVDLLFASSGIETEITKLAEWVELLPDLEARVARLPELVALKLLSRDDSTRPQDAIDLNSLISRATDADLAEVRRLVAMIESRNYQRGRDLEGELDRLLAQMGP